MNDEETKRANERLLQRRTEAEAEAKAETPQPRTPAAVSAISGEAVAKLERLAQQTQEALGAFRRWCLSQPPPKCRRHGTSLEIDEATAAILWLKDRRLEMRTKPCPLCEEEAAAPTIANWLLSIGVPGKLTGATLDNFVAATAPDRETVAKAREFLQVRRGFFVVASRTLGNGKSHLAVAILRAFRKGRYFAAQNLPAMLSAQYRSDYALDVVEAGSKARLLVLDDVGTELGRKDALPALQAIMTNRYDDRLPTVLTTNLGEKELAEYIGERLASRLTEATFAVRTLTGPSHRAAKRQDYFTTPNASGR